MNNPLEVNIPFSGVYVVNEGNFMYDNASLSYYDSDSMKVLNQVFYRTNGVPLGDVAQSMVIHGNKGYIVVNNSGKVYIIDINTFQYLGKITGLTSPRHIHFINEEKAYVTDLYAKSITVINPGEMTVTGTIDVSNKASEYYQHPTEQMVQYGKFLFTNCWSFDNKILVIDTESDRLIDSIEVVRQPQSLVIDRNNKLWVLSDGSFEGSEYGMEEPALTRIDAESRLIEKVLRFDASESPSRLTLNGTGDTLYFINRHVYRYAVTGRDNPELVIPSAYESSSSGGYFGLGVDPGNSDIYVADAIDFVQQGMVYRYTSEGYPLDTFRVGITPSSFCFKPSNQK
ncbi:MAG: YncE family protein [Bacteroidales bacterium]|nr:YncE family protein [Bacteroidales bacterium]